MRINIKITANNKQLTQTLLIAKNEVLIEINEQKLIFFKELNEYFKIDEPNKTLVNVDNVSIQKQLESIKQMLGKIEPKIKNETQSYKDYKSRELEFNSSQNGFSINSQIKTIELNGIAETAFPAFQEFEKQTQLIDIPLEQNEIVAYNKTEIITAQGVQIQELELISVEEQDCTEEINTILSYQMAN